jgi:undecaprenyl-diphosphatase
MAWALLAALTLIRVFYAGQFPLSADEAYYWQWSRYLELGYHDHPPMVAWTIWLATTLLGPHETAVRLPAIAALFGANAYLLLMAQRWYGERVALATALLTQTVLLFNVGALINTPDSFQALAWAGALYHVARAYEVNGCRHWCAGGLWFGFGMLSKLSMAIFPPVVFLYGLVSPYNRSRLKGWRPYLGCCLGLLLMLPMVIWNLENDWRAFRHVAHQGGVASGNLFVPRYFGDYLLSQLALLSPVVFLLYGGLLARTRQLLRPNPETWMTQYLWITAIPVFLLFAVLSTHTRVEGNWPAFGYLGACVLLAAIYGKRPIWRWATATAGIMSLAVLLQAVFPLVPLPLKLDRIAQELSDWRPVGQKVLSLQDSLPKEQKAHIFALNYQTASRLAFYTPGQPRTVAINRGKRPNTYDYWWEDEDLVGCNAIVVTDSPKIAQTRLRPFFESVAPPTPVSLYDHRPGWNAQPQVVRTLYLYRAYGYKGGHGWKPQKADDIRLGS